MDSLQSTDASSNCPCFCIVDFQSDSQSGIAGKGLVFRGGKRGGENTSLITTRRRSVFAISVNRETSGSKGGLFHEIDWFYDFSLKPRWKSVILHIVLPFDYDRLVYHRLIPLRTHDRSVLFARLHYFIWSWLFHLSDCNYYIINLIIYLFVSSGLICSTWLTIANLYYLSNDDYYLCFKSCFFFIRYNKTG